MTYIKISHLYLEVHRGDIMKISGSVTDKEMVAFIETSMTRCIHCTRCVRYLAEVAGVPELGTTGRGGQMEISSYITRQFPQKYQEI